MVSNLCFVVPVELISVLRINSGPGLRSRTNSNSRTKSISSFMISHRTCQKFHFPQSIDADEVSTQNVDETAVCYPREGGRILGNFDA